MAGGGGDREQNYWPGFVDALSNVVLTLVFVLVVFVFALTIMANKASKAVEQIVQQRLAEQQQKAVQASAGKSDSTALTEDSKGLELEAKTEEKKQANRGAAKMETSEHEITIIYPQATLDLDDASMAALQHSLESKKGELEHSHVRIESYLGSESYSLAQRLAYYRAIRVRNLLIQGGLAKPENVTNKIVSTENKGDGRVRIIFTQ